MSDTATDIEHEYAVRPWGSWEVLNKTATWKVKRLVVNPGQRLSLQKHWHRSEHWVVVSGTAQVIVDDRDFLLYENQSTYIPQGSVHRLSNPGLIPLTVIEVQSGLYLEEDDVIRFDV